MALDVQSGFRCLTLAEVFAQLYRRGWKRGTASIRLPGGEQSLIAASGSNGGLLTDRDVVRVRIDDSGRVCPQAPTPAAETPLHTALYRLFPDCGAVVHAHLPHATEIATLAWRRDEESVWFDGDDAKLSVPVLRHRPRFLGVTEDLADLLTADRPPMLLVAGHGGTAWAPTLEAALDRLEHLESLCRLSLLAEAL